MCGPTQKPLYRTARGPGEARDHLPGLDLEGSFARIAKNKSDWSEWNLVMVVPLRLLIHSCHLILLEVPSSHLSEGKVFNDYFSPGHPTTCQLIIPFCLKAKSLNNVYDNIISKYCWFQSNNHVTSKNMFHRSSKFLKGKKSLDLFYCAPKKDVYLIFQYEKYLFLKYFLFYLNIFY